MNESLKRAQAKYAKTPQRRAQIEAYSKEHYERVTLRLYKGMKDEIKAAGIESINGYIVDLIRSDLDKRKAGTTEN